MRQEQRPVFTTLISTRTSRARRVDGDRRGSSSTCGTISRNPTPGRNDATARATFRARGSRTSIRDLSATKTGRNGGIRCRSPEACAKRFGRLGIDAHEAGRRLRPGAGMYAARLWWMLRWLGHDAVAVLDGGFSAWTREGRPVTDRTFRPAAACRFSREADLRGDDDATRVAIANLVELAHSCCSTLGRASVSRRCRAARSVAGHIPARVNRPYFREISTPRDVSNRGRARR
jgi:thiosulfate/3-mercaptopyruvate sulfurtransferase